MRFYPLVYTRTALPSPAKGRGGVDFAYRATPPGFVDSSLETLTRQTINEDRFAKATTPRRVFYRTERIVFWGLGLHNDFFLPSEVCDALEMSDGERGIRGFWGGLIELSDGERLSRETLGLIAATLESREADCASNASRPSEKEAFVGRSPFVFASRLFQYFVQKNWTSSKFPRRVGERNINNAPLVSETPFDLRFFAPQTNGPPECASEPIDALQTLASTDFNDVAAVNALWRKIVFAPNKRVRVVAPLTCENQADRCVADGCELDATALLGASGVRVYRPSTTRSEPETKPETAPEPRPAANKIEAERPKAQENRRKPWDERFLDWLEEVVRPTVAASRRGKETKATGGEKRD